MSEKRPSLKVGTPVRCIHGCGHGQCVVTMVHWDERMQTYFYGLDGEDASKEGIGHHRTDLRKIKIDRRPNESAR